MGRSFPVVAHTKQVWVWVHTVSNNEIEKGLLFHQFVQGFVHRQIRNLQYSGSFRFRRFRIHHNIQECQVQSHHCIDTELIATTTENTVIVISLNLRLRMFSI